MTTITLPTIDAAASIAAPTTFRPYDAGDDITVIPSFLPVPGLGVLPAHSFVIGGREPLLVDAGPGGAQAMFQEALRTVLDPADLRWLVLTHTDPDHVGSLVWLLDAAPQLRIVTNYLAVGKLGMQMPVPMDRLVWVNPGEELRPNGRVFAAMRPPVYDAPETTAFFDRTSGTLFAADTFGALLERPVVRSGDVEPSLLSDGLTRWSMIDAPWVSSVDRDAFARSLDAVAALDVQRVLSAHLPPHEGGTPVLLEVMATLPDATPWQPPDQSALDAMLGRG